MRPLLPWLVLAAVAGALVLSSGPRSGGGRPGGVGAGTATVVRVVDGDTVVVRQGARTDRVRYIGIDTPESVKPNTPVQCYAHAAARRNARLVAGRPVRLVPGAEPRDRYGRLLAYVYRSTDGTFVNEALVRDGYARPLTIAPNDRYAARFTALAAAAARRGDGLWGAC